MRGVLPQNPYRQQAGKQEVNGKMSILHGKFLHGGDYNPDQWLDRPDILEEDVRQMKRAGVNVVWIV